VVRDAAEFYEGHLAVLGGESDATKDAESQASIRLLGLGHRDLSIREICILFNINRLFVLEIT
jgi:hypothetical protein